MAVPLMARAQSDTDSLERLAETMSEGTTMLGTYYADRFVGRRTSCGEIFRHNQYTAAHKTIPMGTYLLVTYPVTNQHVVVRVNDRCPKPGILDMTKLAVHSIGIRGSGKVTVRILDPNMGYFLWSSQDTLAMTEAEYRHGLSTATLRPVHDRLLLTRKQPLQPNRNRPRQRKAKNRP